MTPLRIHVLALRDCTAFVPVGLVDLLRKSAALAVTLPGADARRSIEVTLVAADRQLTVAGIGGVRVRCDAMLRDVASSDLVLVPALDPDVLERMALNRQVVPWLRGIYEAGADIASACTGAFLLAESGLLDRRAATTHWAHQEAFRQRYPLVKLVPEAIVVDQGRVITSGGATSFLNLALYLIERVLGAEVARAASRMFLIDVNKAPQSAYAIFATQRAHGDEEVLRAQGIIEGEFADALTVDELARRVAMSSRNFVRRFKRATGNAPREYLGRVRVEAAKRALEQTPRPVAAIAADVGYEDVVAFRQLFARTTGLTPSEYRARHRAVL